MSGWVLAGSLGFVVPVFAGLLAFYLVERRHERSRDYGRLMRRLADEGDMLLLFERSRDILDGDEWSAS